MLLDVYSEVHFSFDENYSCDIGLFFYYQRAYVIPLGCIFILGLRVTSQLLTGAFQIVHLGVALNFLPILFLRCTLVCFKKPLMCLVVEGQFFLEFIMPVCKIVTF